MANASWAVFGVPGWGSVLAEAMLVRCGVPYRFVDVEGFDRPGATRDRLLQVNPMAQVPTLLLPDGTVMTEGVAVALLLSESFPHARLAPLAGSPGRALFLRRLVWLGTAIYSTFSYGDYPERWSPSNPEELRTRVEARRCELWRSYEAELVGGPEPPASPPTALDIFVCAMTHWRPRRPWFQAECPSLYAKALAADADEALAPVWRRNFPEG